MKNKFLVIAFLISGTLFAAKTYAMSQQRTDIGAAEKRSLGFKVEPNVASQVQDVALECRFCDQF